MESVYDSGQYDVKARCNFTGPRNASLGKVMDNSFTREKARYRRRFPDLSWTFVYYERILFVKQMATEIRQLPDFHDNHIDGYS